MYIRTRNSVEEVTKIINENANYNKEETDKISEQFLIYITTRGHYFYQYENIIEGNSIEELCDEFYLVEDSSKNTPTSITEEILKNHKSIKEFIGRGTVYGAIWVKINLYYSTAMRTIYKLKPVALALHDGNLKLLADIEKEL